MSLKLAGLYRENPDINTREELLALAPKIEYLDGRTKQCHRDECDIQKIMARFDRTGTISHLEKNQGVYADFSDFDFQTQTNMLARGREIFAELPAEVRQEFGQSAAAFFEYVNDPANIDELREKLPALAAPGRQLNPTSAPSADEEAADNAANTPTIPLTEEASTPPADTQEV